MNVNVVNTVSCFYLGLHGKVGKSGSRSSQVTIPITLVGTGANYPAAIDLSFGQNQSAVPDALTSITLALAPNNAGGVGASTIRAKFVFGTGQIVNVSKTGMAFISHPFTFNVLQQNPIRFNLQLVITGWAMAGTTLNFIVTLSNRRVRKNLGV